MTNEELLVVGCCDENDILLPTAWRTWTQSAVIGSCRTVCVHGFGVAELERGLSAGGGGYWLFTFKI